MNKTIFFSKRLDDSPESVKDSKNNDTQTASQTTANGQAEKESRWARKRIGLLAVLALTCIATMLTTSLIEQAGAASASTNQITRQTPPSYRSKSPTTSTNRVIPRRSRNIAAPSRAMPTRTARTNQVQTPSRRTIPVPNRSRTRPAAVPVPVVVVAKPVLKKGAIVAGKWLIAVLAEYGVHSALDRVFQNNKDQEAYVTVQGALWLSNEYFWRSSSPHTPSPRNVLTTIATMKKEDDPESAISSILPRF